VDEIRKLLEQAETPLERSILLMMMEQSRATLALTQSMDRLAAGFDDHRKEFMSHKETVSVLDEKFDRHVIEEGTLLTWGTKTFAITCGLLVFIVGLFGWYTVRHIIDVNVFQQATIDSNSNRLTALEAVIKQIAEQHNGERR
jgi:hypothetical protein